MELDVHENSSPQVIAPRLNLLLMLRFRQGLRLWPQGVGHDSELKTQPGKAQDQAWILRIGFESQPQDQGQIPETTT